jgi:hypothetical protein
MYLKNSEPSIPGIIREEHTCLHSEPARKGWSKKKNKKKTLGINLGQSAEKGREKKTLVLTLGRSLDLDFRTWSYPSVEVLSVRRGPETKIGTWTHEQTNN